MLTRAFRDYYKLLGGMMSVKSVLEDSSLGFPSGQRLRPLVSASEVAFAQAEAEFHMV